MARTIMVSNADFSGNALDQVIFADIPCTGIALDTSSADITAIGSTVTLTATVTPADTTDVLIWSSSDASVASVSGGIVTALKVGSATITATCGEYSASCQVEITHTAVFVREINMYLSKNDNYDYLNGGTLANYAIGYSENGEKNLYNNANRHPVPIPDGATKMEITAPGFKPYGFWVSATEGSQYGASTAKAYEKDDFGTSGEQDYRLVTIPDRTTGTYEGMNAVGLVFRYMNGTITQEAADAIVVRFTA